MTSSIRLLLAATSLASGLLLNAPAFAEAQPLRFDWPQAHSDIAPDPAARFGRLPNGMTYVIYKNATPPGAVSVHLRIAAGSLMETDNERGLAHFIEHMAFNGSTNIPKDQLLPLLQNHGVKLGPDAGAFTLPNKTEYILDLPKNDADSVDTALKVTREFAGNLLFAPDAVERERAVILGEERLRETPQVLAQTNWMQAAFPGQKFATRGNPIGLPDIIKTASPETLKALYHALYRPELATLIVVGDVDPDQIEAKIKAAFSNWQPIGPARSVDFGDYRTKGETTFTYTGQSLPDVISATWFQSYNPAPQTRRTSDEDSTDTLLIAVLNMRLQRLAQQPDTAFAAASVAMQPIYETAKVLQLNLVPKPGKDKLALEQALGAVHQFAAMGVSAQEVAPVLAQLDAFFKQQVAGAATRDNEAIVTNLVSNLDSNSVFTSPQQDLTDYEQLVKNLTPDTLNARLKVLFSGDGPLLSHTAQDLAGMDAAAMEASFKSVMSAKTDAYATTATKAWPYTDFGASKPPVGEKTDAEFGITRYSFANGLTLNIKPTQFKTHQVLVKVAFKGGLEALSPDTQAPVMLTGVYAGANGFFAGGLGKLDLDDLQKTLAGKTVSLSYGLGEDQAVLSGATTPADLATQMQLMMAFTMDAAYRPAFYNQLQGAMPAVYAQLTGSPGAVLQTHLGGLLHAHDNRYAFPYEAQAKATPFDQVKSLLQTSLQNRPIDITMVGDIDPKQAVDAIAATFATLPTLPKTAPVAPGGDHVAFPTSDLDQTLYHKGRADQSVSLITWPVPDILSDTQTSRGLQILAEILNQRAFDTVREKLGQAYDANASLSQSDVFKNYGVIQISGSVATGQDQAFVQAVNAIVDDLKAHPVSQDELDRARKPVLERWQTSQTDNTYWFTVTPLVAGSTAWAKAEASAQAQFMKVTPDMIMALAKTYLVNAKAMHVKVLPQPQTAAK